MDGAISFSYRKNAWSLKKKTHKSESTADARGSIHRNNPQPFCTSFFDVAKHRWYPDSIV